MMHDDARLDSLLAAWAREQRIGRRDADAMLQAITTPAGPEELPGMWWLDLSAHVSAAVVLANARPDTGLPFDAVLAEAA